VTPTLCSRCTGERIALIGCSKKKVAGAVDIPAGELYQGQLFKAQLLFARHSLMLPDALIFVLSAKHGLVSLDEPLDYYNLSLVGMAAVDRAAWGWRVLTDIQYEVPHAEFAYVLASGIYLDALRRPFESANIRFERPVPAHLGYALQVKWYQEAAKYGGVALSAATRGWIDG